MKHMDDLSGYIREQNRIFQDIDDRAKLAEQNDRIASFRKAGGNPEKLMRVFESCAKLCGEKTKEEVHAYAMRELQSLLDQIAAAGKLGTDSESPN